MMTFIQRNMKAILLISLIVLNLCVAAWGDDAANVAITGANKNTIVIKEFAFNPPTLTVKSGETITWINRDEEPHTVVSVEKQFKKSPALDTDEKFTVTAGSPGTYTYFCSVHPKMTGTIIVEK